MTDIKNGQERDELHRAIWSIANNLRGSVDGWDFKNYVLGTMFYRYVSESFAADINQIEEESGNIGFDYAKCSDEDVEIEEDERINIIKAKGFFLKPSELFCNVRQSAANDENLNETLERIFNNITNGYSQIPIDKLDAEEIDGMARAKSNFAGLFDDFDVNSNKLGATVAKRNERLRLLLDGIANMNLSYTDSAIDAFGDAYEYLMSMYASNAGKSGGEYFTPQEVSELLARLAVVGRTSVNKVYDPACGSGSLLLQAKKVLGENGVEEGFYGQEINITTYNLCRINMFLHGVGFDKFHVACDDTLLTPRHWDDQPFDLIVSNPPYGVRWNQKNDPLLINDPRYAPAGVLAPQSKGDFAFIMHSLHWLSATGTAAIVCFPGIMYRGGAEQKIRKYLIDNNFVDCVIQLPENLFFGTQIATCIMTIKRNKKDDKVLFINATKECVKVTNNNKMTKDNIQRVIEIYTDRKDVECVSHLASYNEIVDQNYNLSVSTYVTHEDTREKIDIVSLNSEIERIVAKENELRAKIDRIIKEIEG